MAGPKPDITELPAYPVRGEPRDTFATKANAYVAAQSDTFVPEMNDALDWINVVLGEFLVFLAAVQSAEGLPAISGKSGYGLVVKGGSGNETVEFKPGASFEEKSGLKVSNSSSDSDPEHDIGVTSGWIWDSTLEELIVLSSGRVKGIDSAYSVSTTATKAGGLSSETTLSDGMILGEFLIYNPSTSAADLILADSQTNALADTEAVANGLTKARYIGAQYIFDAGGGDYQCKKYVDGRNGWRLFKEQPIEVSTTASTSGALRTAPVPPYMRGRFTYYMEAFDNTGSPNINVAGLLTTPEQDNTVPTSSIYTLFLTSAFSGPSSARNSALTTLELPVNGSSQIRHREAVTNGDAVANSSIYCHGWQMDYTITDLV